MATRGFQNFTLDERQSLIRMRKARLGVAEMTARLDCGLAVTSYFCDPRSPWQKSAVENANGCLPSDVPTDRLTADSLQTLADRFNATPRQCLGFRTPAEVFNGRLDPSPGGAAASSSVSQ